MITTLLVDDEQGNIITLQQMLHEYCPQVSIVATANNIDEAYKAIKIHQPQLVLLDIEMPNGTGFDLLNKITNINFSVIFVTAFNQYAIKAIKYAAADYILKPVNIEELIEAIEKLSHKLHQHESDLRLKNLLHTINHQPKHIHRITIPTHDGYVYEDLDGIMYLQASSNYSTLFINKKYKILAARTIKDFEDMLPTNIFCRVHNSFIVNINYVAKYQKHGRGGTIEMTDATEIEVSVRKRDEFLKMMNP